MKHLMAAKKLIHELVQDDRIEVRRGEIVGRHLAQRIDEWGRPPTGDELEEWLDEHRLVTEVFVGARDLDEVVRRHFSAAFTRPEVVEEARHPVLEQEIRNAPDQVEAYMVYSDWLQERSDPLGKLIACGIAADRGDEKAAAEFDRYLKKHREWFFGNIDGYLPTQIQLEWRYGLVREIRVPVLDGLADDIRSKLLRLRVCGFVDSIQMAVPRLSTGANALAGLEVYAPSSLRRLALTGFTDLIVPETLFQRPIEQLSLQGFRVFIPDVLPDSLVELRLQVTIVDSAHQRPPRWAVRALEFLFTEYVAGFLAEVELDRLQRLSVSMHRYDGSPAALPALLGALDLPALVHVELRDGRLARLRFDAIAKLPLARQVRSLALTRLGLTDDAVAGLIDDLRRFESLAELDVTGNELTRQGLETLQAVVPAVVSRRQNPPGTAAHEDLRAFAGSRWQVAQEIADPSRWRRAGIDGDLRWARYRGTEDYELFVTRDLTRYGCTCPSGIQPCKHVVALALVAENHELTPAPSGGIEHRAG